MRMQRKSARVQSRQAGMRTGQARQTMDEQEESVERRLSRWESVLWRQHLFLRR